MVKKKTLSKKTFEDAAVASARIADEFRAVDVEVLDMEGIFELTDFFVIASCDNRRQLRAIGNEVSLLFKERGISRIGVEGWESGGWLLLDFAGVIVHLFLEDARRYYEMDYLWGDALRVAWEEKNT